MEVLRMRKSFYNFIHYFQKWLDNGISETWMKAKNAFYSAFFFEKEIKNSYIIYK